MIIRKVGIASLARILATIYGALGLIAGAVLSILALAGFGAGESSGVVLFGSFAVVLLPLFYLVVGYVAGAVTGWIFNRAAAMWGGLEIEVEATGPAASSA